VDYDDAISSMLLYYTLNTGKPGGQWPSEDTDQSKTRQEA